MNPAAGPSARTAPAVRTRALGNGVLFLLGALADPVETFHRARGRRYWVTAAVLLGVVQAVELGRREVHPVIWVSLPVLLLLSLMATYPLTAMARTLCGGPAWLTDATASQGVILGSAAVLPGSLLVVLGVPALTTFLVSLVLLALAVVAQISLWTAAFRCRWWLATLAWLVTTAVVGSGAYALSALLGPTLDYLSG